MKEVIEALVEGGKATPGPPLGPKLGPLGINVGKLISDVNKVTKDFSGMRVPVKLIIDTDTKTWEIEVGTPPTSQLLLKEVKAEKGAKTGEEKIGNLTIEQIIKIAKIKMKEMDIKDLKSAVKVVLGTCKSMGITIDGKDPREIQKAIDKGEIKIE